MNDFKNFYLTEDNMSGKDYSRFVTILINYLDKRFPSYGDLITGIGEELGKLGLSTDEMEKIRIKVSKLINNEKVKFLNRIRAHVGKIYSPQSEPVKPVEPAKTDTLMIKTQSV